jgi:hypothetical protein
MKNTFVLSLIIPKLFFTLVHFCTYFEDDCIVFVDLSLSEAIKYTAKSCLSLLKKFSILRPNCLIRWRLTVSVRVYFYAARTVLVPSLVPGTWF